MSKKYDQLVVFSKSITLIFDMKNTFLDISGFEMESPPMQKDFIK